MAVGDRPHLEVIEAGEALLARAHQAAQAITRRVRRVMAAEGLSALQAAASAASQGPQREGGSMLALATLEQQTQASEFVPNTTSWELASFGVRRADEVGAAAGAVAASMAAAGYPDADVSGMHASLVEALRSAVQHAPAREVLVVYTVTPEEARAEVQDPGPGQAHGNAVTLRQRRSTE
jgi:hypothetical protein